MRYFTMANLYVGYIQISVIADNKQDAMKQIRERIAEVPNQFVHNAGYAPTAITTQYRALYGDNTTVLRDMVNKTK